MGIDTETLNSTSLMNNTCTLDYFCTSFLTAPLAVGTISVFSACVGVPAGVWLLWVLIQRQRSGLFNVYMLNLTIIDLIFNITIIPRIVNYFVWHDVTVLFAFQFFYFFNMCGRPLFMALICVDCYVAVVHPITYLKIRSGRHRLVTCVLAWIITLVCGCICTVSRSGSISNATLSIPLGLSVPLITFCDLSILYSLKKPDPSGRHDVHPQKQRAMQTIINSLVMALVSYFPVLVVSLIPYLNLIHMSQELMCNMYTSISIASALGSTIMPLLHLGDLGRLQDIRPCVRKCSSFCFSLKD